MKIDSSASPCRQHPCSAEHADLVRTFWSMRDDWERDAEAATGGYGTEMHEYRKHHPPPQLRSFLIMMKRSRQ